MPIIELLNQLAQYDIRLWLEQDQLRYSAPDGAMTAERIALLRQYKVQLIDFLQNTGKSAHTIAHADTTQPQLASSAQQRLWFIQTLDPHSSTLHINAALSIRGELNFSALEHACREIIQRHSILRTSYYQSSGKLYQKILQQWQWHIQRIEAKQETLDAQLLQDSQAPFNLNQAPLMRCSLFRLNDTHHIANITFHHIAADGWSLGVFVSELVALYQNQNAALAPLTYQYVDYAHFQHSEEQQALYSKQLTYWKKQLHGVPALQLAHKTSLESDAHIHTFSLDSAMLNTLSQRFNSTLFHNLMALFSCLLYRYSQQEDFCIGTPVAGRNASAFEPLIGCFINVLAIRCEPQGESTFSDYLQSVKNTCNQALAMQDIAFERVVQGLDLPRDLDSGLFQTMLSVQNTPFSHVTINDLTIELLEPQSVQAQYDLKLSAFENDAIIECAFEYKTALFSKQFITQLTQHFILLCRQACQTPEHPLSRFTLYHNATQINTQPLLNDQPFLHHAVEQFAEKTPHAIAVRYQEQTLNYAQLNERANQLAHYLQAQGIGKHHFVAVLLERSLELIPALLAVLKVGAAYIPLDEDLPAERLAFILQDSQAHFAFCRAHHTELLTNTAHLALTPNHTLTQSTDNLHTPINADEPAYLLYTSGSTGTPKGVIIPHRGLNHYLYFASKEYLPTLSASVVSSTISFDATITTLFTPFIQGKTVILSNASDDDFTDLQQLIRNTHNTLFKITPAHLSLLANQSATLFSDSAHTFIIGGEQLLTSQITLWLTKIAPNARFVNEYGPTETVVGCAIYSVDKRSDLTQLPFAVPIGKAVDYCQLLILDKHLNAVPQSMTGELYITGASLATAYLNLNEKTQQSFITLAISPQENIRAYKTGDLVRMLDHGELLYIGRADDQVKLRGQRIELGEIEASILAFDRSIKHAIATLYNHQNDMRLVAWYNAEAPINELALSAFLRQRLPAYMLPAAFVSVESWPLSSNGKINKNKLPAPQWQAHNTPFVAPSSNIEKQLATIWQDVLHNEKIGIHDNFFELGGHSLSAAQAIALAKEQFAVELPLRDIFEQPTIAAIAAQIERALIAKQVLDNDLAQEDQDSESFVL